MGRPFSSDQDDEHPIFADIVADCQEPELTNATWKAGFIRLLVSRPRPRTAGNRHGNFGPRKPVLQLLGPEEQRGRILGVAAASYKRRLYKSIIDDFEAISKAEKDFLDYCDDVGADNLDTEEAKAFRQTIQEHKRKMRESNPLGLNVIRLPLEEQPFRLTANFDVDYFYLDGFLGYHAADPDVWLSEEWATLRMIQNVIFNIGDLMQVLRHYKVIPEPPTSFKESIQARIDELIEAHPLQPKDAADAGDPVLARKKAEDRELCYMGIPYPVSAIAAFPGRHAHAILRRVFAMFASRPERTLTKTCRILVGKWDPAAAWPGALRLLRAEAIPGTSVYGLCEVKQTRPAAVAWERGAEGRRECVPRRAEYARTGRVLSAPTWFAESLFHIQNWLDAAATLLDVSDAIWEDGEEGKAWLDAQRDDLARLLSLRDDLCPHNIHVFPARHVQYVTFDSTIDRGLTETELLEGTEQIG
jgi:hypothetical protein